MDFDLLWTVAERARTKVKLLSQEIEFVRDVIPGELESFPRLNLPKSIRHPGGFSVAGAPVGTFLRSALLIAGQRALGRRFRGSAFYEKVEQDLAFGIMRSHFHHGYPKGAHCCVQCTLAVYPVLKAGAIRYFDCAELATNLQTLITEGQWRFSKPANPKMTLWVMRQLTTEESTISDKPGSRSRHGSPGMRP
jgi:hypothetical protein